MRSRGDPLRDRARSGVATSDSCVRASRIAASSYREPVPLAAAAIACAHDAAHACTRADVRTDSYGKWQLPERQRRPTLVTARDPTRVEGSSNVVSPKKDSR